MFTIEAVMSTELKTIGPSATLAEARELMQEHRIHHLPVVQDGVELVGLLTLTDVLRATDSFLREQDERIRAADVRVHEKFPFQPVDILRQPFSDAGGGQRQARGGA